MYTTNEHARFTPTKNPNQRGKSSSTTENGIFSRGNSIMVQNRNNAINNNHAASDAQYNVLENDIKSHPGKISSICT